MAMNGVNVLYERDVGRNKYRKAFSESSWCEGLRGISAIFVLASHLILCFARYIVSPGQGQDEPAAWMQLPFLRLVGQGPAWVALFFILSGFVNALKPITLARAGDAETALSNIAVSSFRRLFRLFLPATSATLLSWLLTQFGAYETARQSNAFWLFTTSPSPSKSWLLALGDIREAVRSTWCYWPKNVYDQPQWAMLYLLQGSMFVFMALLVTINLTPSFRMSTIALCYFWSINWGQKLADPLAGMNVFAGVVLAELDRSGYPLRLSHYSPYFVPPLATCGLFLMSFPADFQQKAWWSNALLRAHETIAPTSADLARFWPSIGAQVLVLSIVLSPHLRRALAHRWLLWLGKISFPLYLLHGSLMRSLLAWLLFAKQRLTWVEYDGDHYMRYPLPGIGTFLLAMPLFSAILFMIAHIWATKVEPWFGFITKKAEVLMIGKDKRPTVLPIRHD